MTRSSVVVASRDQVSADLGGEAVILGLDKGVYYGLANVALRAWALIQTPRTVDEVCDALVAEYDVDRATCLQDLETLFGRMAREGLVEISDEATS